MTYAPDPAQVLHLPTTLDDALHCSPTGPYIGPRRARATPLIGQFQIQVVG